MQETMDQLLIPGNPAKPGKSGRKAAKKQRQPLNPFGQDEQPFQFIVTTPAQKNAKSQSRQIRSHVARKKAEHKTYRQLSSCLGETYSPTQYAAKRETLVESPTYTGLMGTLTCLPPNIEPLMIQEASRFLHYTNNVFYPPGLCMLPDPDGSIWFQHLIRDTVLLNALVFANQALSDHLAGGQGGFKGQVRQLKALRLLQDRINSTDLAVATSDPTIMAIITLALSSEVFQSDYTSLTSHLHGLSKLVAMRGGLKAFTYAKDELVAKICRVDLGLALRSGQPPLLLNQQETWDPYLALRQTQHPETISYQQDIHELRQSLDTRIIYIWDDFGHLCKTLNISHQTGYKIRQDYLSDALISILYRLLNFSAEYRLVEEALRLGMLALGCKLFMPWKQDFPRYEGIRDDLGRVLLRLRESDSVNLKKEKEKEMPDSIVLWLCIQWCMLSPLRSLEKKGRNASIREMFNELGVDTWPEARARLKSILWVDTVNDLQGRTAFDMLCNRDRN